MRGSLPPSPTPHGAVSISSVLFHGRVWGLGSRSPPSEERPCPLGGQDAEPPLQGQAMPGELVVGGKTGRVGRTGGLSGRGHLLRGRKGKGETGPGPPEPSRSPPRYLQGINALAALIGVALQEHGAVSAATAAQSTTGRGRSIMGKGGGVGAERGVASPGAGGAWPRWALRGAWRRRALRRGGRWEM